MSVRLLGLVFAACAFCFAAAVTAGGPGCACNYAAQTNCGVPQSAGNYCPAPQVVVVCGKHHCKHHGCAHWMPAPPVGPVVSSVAAPQFTSLSTVGLMAAPVSLAYVAPQAYVPQAIAPQAAPLSHEATCNGTGSKVLELESRIDLIQRRLDRVQSNMDEQTDLLREIANRLVKIENK
jgi:hypothetical protein